MNISESKYNKGFTLIELLLSMVFGLIVLSGVTYIYVAVVVSSSETLKNTKLNTQIVTLMSIMTNDIRRAGYWFNDEKLAPTQNPFNEEDDSLLVIVKGPSDNTKIVENEAQSGQCILYSYDRDLDGDVDNINNKNEYFGFRLYQGKVQMRAEGTVTLGSNCSNGTWEDLSDGDLYQIDALTFSPVSSTCVNSSEPDGEDSSNDSDNITDDDGEKNCYMVDPSSGQITVETREILITLQGTLKSDSSVTVTLTQSVRVRNDSVKVSA